MILKPLLRLARRVARVSIIPAFCSMGLYAQAPAPCPRLPAGSVIDEPQNLFSSHGVLSVNFTYRAQIDLSGNTLFCFVTDDGSQSPTLHVNPGDRLIINLNNALPESMSSQSMSAMPGMIVTGSPTSVCGSGVMDSTSVNIHFHGANVAPVCHQDEVIKTVVNSGQSFRYDVHFPADEPPGMYWYHPHIHGISEAAVLGGASGAIIVDGIQNVNGTVAGLPIRTLIVRDNLVPGGPSPGGQVPSWDISLNYIPIAYPAFTPVIIPMRPQEKQFWRVLNGSADTILDLQVQYDGEAQILGIVALDGVSTGSQDGAGTGKTVAAKHILLPPAGRAEFVVTGPAPTVKAATLLTMKISTGPDGDNDPQRPLASIETSASAIEPVLHVPKVSGPPSAGRFAGLVSAVPTATRKLYFSEVLSDPNDPDSPTNFFITVDGQTPVIFNPE